MNNQALRVYRIGTELPSSIRSASNEKNIDHNSNSINMLMQFTDNKYDYE
jgi:hypothetical protein